MKKLQFGVTMHNGKILVAGFLAISVLAQEISAEDAQVKAEGVDGIVIYDRFDGATKGQVVEYFTEQADIQGNCLKMKSWLEGEGFIVSEYRALEAGFPENDNAVRLLASFSEHIRQGPTPKSAFEKIFDLIVRPTEKWSFVDSSTGITVLYSDCRTLLEIKTNPRGL